VPDTFNVLDGQDEEEIAAVLACRLAAVVIFDVAE
jgi:hypothetical protein